MGRVFSWDDVYEGRIPIMDSFLTVDDQLRVCLPKIRGFQGAIVCGSVLWNAHSPRSDLDCFVVYRLEHREECLGCLRKHSEVAAEFHVPLEFIPVAQETINMGCHDVDSMFYEHLQTAAKAGGVIGTNPLPHVNVPPERMLHDFMAYLQHKLGRHDHERARTFLASADRVRFLGKILSDPIHIARRLLQWKGRLNGPGLRNDLLALYEATPGLPSSASLRTVLQVDAEYSAHLLQQENVLDERGYHRMLERIEECSSAAFMFIQEALLCLQWKS